MAAREERVIRSFAPIRICDNGGWTDTWFARTGKVFHIAVHPCVEVQVKVRKGRGDEPRVTVNAENYGDRFTIVEGRRKYERQPLLEATIEFMKVPPEAHLDIAIHSEVPGGCSTGTSAAVSVALIGALDRVAGGTMTPRDVARAAHRIETELLGQQSGIQDQIAAAYGGINYIDMYEYPEATVSPIRLPDAIAWELESRLSLVFVGVAHRSSDVHEMVIRELESAGPDAGKLQPLRRTAEKSRDALLAGDFRALGQAMIENTAAQENLHAALIGPDHRRIIRIAAAHGALGWKVNGAGGAGGSVTILSGSDRTVHRAMLREVQAAEPRYRNIPVRLSHEGLRVWETAEAIC